MPHKMFFTELSNHDLFWLNIYLKQIITKTHLL